MKKLVFLFFVLLSFSLGSCNQTEQIKEIPLSINRLAFIKGHNKDVQKSAFTTLRFDQQRDLWLDKLTQVQQNNLPDNFRNALGEVCNILKNAKTEEELLNNPKLKEEAVKMAGMISPQAYAEIFSSLEDYKTSVKDFKNINLKFAEEVRKDFENIKIKPAFIGSDSTTTGGGDEDYLRACNCRWTCDGWSTTNCEPTSRGCGLLWLFSCKEYS